MDSTLKELTALRSKSDGVLCWLFSNPRGRRPAEARFADVEYATTHSLAGTDSAGSNPRPSGKPAMQPSGTAQTSRRADEQTSRPSLYWRSERDGVRVKTRLAWT